MTRVVFVLTILAVLFPNLGEGAELALEARLRILDQDRAPQGYIRPRQPFFLEAVLELEEDWPGEPPQVGLKVFDQGTLLMEVEGLGELAKGPCASALPHMLDRVSAQVEVAIALQEGAGAWRELERVRVYVVDQPITLPPDRVMMVSKDRLEFEFHGEYPISPTAPVYEYFPDGARPIEFSKFIVGAQDVQATVFQGEIVRIDILTPQVIDKMRVLITTDQFADRDTVLAAQPCERGFRRKNGARDGDSPHPLGAGECGLKEKYLLIQTPRDYLGVCQQSVHHPLAWGHDQIDSFQRGVSPGFTPVQEV